MLVFTFSFINLFVAFGTTARELLTISAAARLSMTIKISDICYNLLVIFCPAFVCLSVCLPVCPQGNSKTNCADFDESLHVGCLHCKN